MSNRTNKKKRWRGEPTVPIRSRHIKQIPELIAAALRERHWLLEMAKRKP